MIKCSWLSPAARKTRLVAGLTALTGTLAAVPAHAQVPVPAVTVEVQDSVTRPITPTERFHGRQMFKSRVYGALAPSAPLYPKDSMDNVVIKRATGWLARFRGQPVAPLQYVGLAQLNVATIQDDAAQGLFKTGLTATGLTSPHDKAYTLMKAVQSFADPDDPDRREIAETYMTQLDALPKATALWQCRGHALLALAYDEAGLAEQTVSHANKALDLFTSVLTFQDRFRALGEIADTYIALANILALRPSARGQIDQLNAKLETAAILPPELAEDSAAQESARALEQTIRRIIPQASTLGKKAPSIVAQMWLNREKADYHTEPMADGKVRFVMFTRGYGSPIGPALERMKKALDGKAEVLLVTSTSGSWGFSFTTPQAESGNLKKYFLERQKYTFPIALWVGEKQRTPQGGMLPQRSPNNSAYAVGGTQFYAIDKSGMVVYTNSGSFSRDMEARMVKLLETLSSASAPSAK